MRVLFVTRFLTGLGGGLLYAQDLENLLTSSGHCVSHFANCHPKNGPSVYADFFVKDINFTGQGIGTKVRTLIRATFASEVTSKLNALLDKHPVDVVHIHELHHGLMPPAAFRVLKARGIPTVCTLHDASITCPNHYFFSYTQMSNCERCVGGKYWNTLFSKCAGPGLENRVKEFIYALEGYWAKLVNIDRCIDYYIAPSRYLGNRVMALGIPARKVRVIPYIAFAEYGEDKARDTARAGFVYAGRFTEDKGVYDLLASFQASELPLTILGDGPLRQQITLLTQTYPNISVSAKPLPPEAVRQVMKHAKAVVVPSLVTENSPKVIYDSFTVATPVIATRVGGIPELVSHGEEGFLFDPHDINALTNYCKLMNEDASMVENLGAKAKQKAMVQWNAVSHLNQILQVYEDACQRKSSMRS